MDAAERRRQLTRLHAERPKAELPFAGGSGGQLCGASQRSLRPYPAPERETLANPDSQPAGTRPATQ